MTAFRHYFWYIFSQKGRHFALPVITKPPLAHGNLHFNNNEHTFSKHGKFMIIEQLRNINISPTEIEIERKRKVLDQETWNFDTIWLNPRTDLIPCYAVPAMFTLLSSFWIWTKNLTYISQLTSNIIISCCKSHSELCPLKTASVKTSWELLYCFY